MEKNIKKTASQELSKQRKHRSCTIVRYKKQCENCGKNFLGNGCKKYCSRACRIESYYNRIEKKNEKKKEVKKENIINYDMTQYWKKKKENIIKTCKTCGLEFTDKHKTIYCSKKCSKKAGLLLSLSMAKNNEKGYKNGDVIGKCEECEKEYPKKAYNQRFCSDECSIKNYDSIKNCEREPQEHDIKWLKLRFIVLMRDNFTCKYCGRNVKEDNIKIHVDHIVPKSKGGENIVTNLITSCEECNLGKRDILLKQREEVKNES